MEIGILIRAADEGGASLLLGSIIRWQRLAALSRHATAATERTETIGGHDVSIITSNDGTGKVRSYYATTGNSHLIANSPHIVEDFLKAGQANASLSSTPAFGTAERMLQQAAEPRVMLIVPSGFWPANSALHGLGPVVGLLDSHGDGRRSVFVEAEVPFPWIAARAAELGPHGDEVLAVYRQLAQHRPATRIGPVAKDAAFLEVCITDTCRVFGGLREGIVYVGLAETASFDSLRKLLSSWQKDPKQDTKQLAELLERSLAHKDQLCKSEELDRDGYLSPASIGFWVGFLRVFNDRWVAWSPGWEVLKTVTPDLKLEAAGVPATARLRINDVQSVAEFVEMYTAFGQLPALDSSITLELDLVADEQRLLLSNRLNWTGKRQSNQRAPPRPPPAESGEASDWQLLEWFQQLRDYPPLRARTERAILLTLRRLHVQLAASEDTDQDPIHALKGLFELETILLTLDPAFQEPELGLIRDRKERVLQKQIAHLDLSTSSEERWLALFALLRSIPTADGAVRQHLADELFERTNWIDQLDVSLQTAKTLEKLLPSLDERDVVLDRIRARIQTRLVRVANTLLDRYDDSWQSLNDLAELGQVLEATNGNSRLLCKRVESNRIEVYLKLAKEVIFDPNLENGPKRERVHELNALRPKTEAGDEALKSVNEMWRRRP
jgi:hypothetical protein